MSQDVTSVENAVEKMDLDNDDKDKKVEDDDKDKKVEDDDSSIASTVTTDSNENVPPGQADELLFKATTYKEQGNEHFKLGVLDKAAQSYRRGTNAIKKLNKQNTGDEQVKALLVVLQTNLSMVCYKQKKYRHCVDVAGRALEIDPLNVKALYRRAVGHRALANHDQAKVDLKDALKADPANAACKKELAAIKKELEVATQTQKKALAKAFSSKNNSSFLYNDKEAEQKEKEQQAKLKKQQEEEMLKKRKVEWEDDCVKRMANNEAAISFDDWEKERTEKEKARQKEEEKKRREEEKKRKEARKLQAASSSKDSDGSDDELTEQELAMMRGYKKTKDGRVTSYFTRELDDHEKTKIGDIAPKMIIQRDDQNQQPTLLQNIASEGASRPSAWNRAGTWEEKDTTVWCKEQLQKRLEETRIPSSSLAAEIDKVEDLTGDASVAIAGGKRRYIFDFHAKLKYTIRHLDDGRNIASGTLRLPDICSTSHEELEVTYKGWKEKPSVEFETGALASRDALAHEIRESVKRWVQDFNNAY